MFMLLGFHDRVVDATWRGLRMLKTLLALLSGVIFGLGLIVAGSQSGQSVGVSRRYRA